MYMYHRAEAQTCHMIQEKQWFVLAFLFSTLNILCSYVNKSLN